MRNREQEIEDLAQIEKIIHNSTVCRIALCENGVPYIVPLNFGYRDKTLYFHGAKEGKKIDIMKSNANVCFEFDTDLGIVKDKAACNWGNSYKSVIGTGKVSFVENVTKKIEALNIIMQNYSDQQHVFPEKAVENIAVFVIEIDEITGKQSSD